VINASNNTSTQQQHSRGVENRKAENVEPLWKNQILVTNPILTVSQYFVFYLGSVRITEIVEVHFSKGGIGANSVILRCVSYTLF
jgi:hypothetical protein